ncbi:MAG: sulfotransferase [Cyanobacteriota bacterium]|nr:sulfotransferase [Cyanobacteriota bacterium]
MTKDKQPIFIGGLHRSGTSLIRAILGSHPDIAIYSSDLPLWTKFYEKYQALDLNDPQARQMLIEEITTHAKASDLLVTVKDRVEAKLNELSTRGSINFGIVCEQFLQECANARQRSRWGLKTPYNEFFADAIFAAYPNAKMVQMIRDPRNVAVSIQSRGWSKTLNKTCKEWKGSVRWARSHSQKYAGSYIAVRYEDLVQDSETIVKQVCQVVELDYSPDLLQMEGHKGWRGANSYFDDIGYKKQGISQSALNRYVELLDESNLQFIQEHLKDEMTELNYQLEPSRSLI